MKGIYLIGEIGINHNGDLNLAKELMRRAAEAGFDAVKFQKRNPEVCVPENQKTVMRETPWGRMTYLEYKYKVEFEEKEYDEIDRYAKELKIDWFASPWDKDSVDFLSSYEIPFIKIASASITDIEFLEYVRSKNIPCIMSTGMSSMEEISSAVKCLGEEGLFIAHSTSSYPCPPEELNLNMIKTLGQAFPKAIIGYSGHEKGVQTSVVAAAIGAMHIERHITLDRAMWGSDHAASLEPKGFAQLARDIRIIERSMGDGVKKVYDSELGKIKSLRK
jgi:N-acetylneuraminate synthase